MRGRSRFENNRTGEEATLNFEDIAEGRIGMTTSDGEIAVEASEARGAAGGVTFSGPEGEMRLGASASLDDLPDWVPIYPGATDVESAFQAAGPEGGSGAVSAKTTDSAETVVGHYREQFVEQGYTVGTESLTRTPTGAFGIITGERVDDSQSINVMAMEDGGETQLMLNYNQSQP